MMPEIDGIIKRSSSFFSIPFRLKKNSLSIILHTPDKISTKSTVPITLNTQKLRNSIILIFFVVIGDRSIIHSSTRISTK